MHIKRIEAFPLRYPEPNDFNNLRYLTLARIEADDGTVGWGECISQWPESALAVKVIIDRGFGPLLLGRDPLDTSALWHAMKEQSWWYGEGGIASFALSALDMALWDLKGKALGIPLYQILGGKLHDRLRACASTHPSKPTVEAMAQELADHVEKGYTAVKVGLGKKGEARLGQDPMRDIAFVRAVREAVGDEVDFMVDIGHSVRWEVAQAIRMTREFERYHIRWIEDPLRMTDWEGYRRLREAIATPIATGENEWTAAAYHRLIQAGIGDIILVDPGRSEGVTGYQKVIEMTVHAHCYINAHSWSSALNTAASLHLTATAPNYIIMEMKPAPSPMQHELVTEPIEQQDGWLTVPEGPGLGVEVNEDVVRKYLFE